MKLKDNNYKRAYGISVYPPMASLIQAITDTEDISLRSLVETLVLAYAQVHYPECYMGYQRDLKGKDNDQ